jgi:prophage antirepressor-like protein
MTEQRITPFLFEGEHTIREIDVDGTPKFVAKDVAAALGYKNTTFAVKTHCKHGVPLGARESRAPSAIDPQTIIIPESDVFRLVLRSKLPDAERFEMWLMEEVLPAIRRTGRYAANDAPMLSQHDFDQWSNEELRTRNSTVTIYRQALNNVSAVWMMERLGYPMPPTQLQPDWKQSDLWPVPPGSVTITVTPQERQAA